MSKLVPFYIREDCKSDLDIRVLFCNFTGLCEGFLIV